jgi:hypothetical protein
MSDARRLETAINFITAKPLAWVLYWLWLALKHSWRGVVWCAGWIRDRVSRKASQQSTADPTSPVNGRPGCLPKRQPARR